MFGFPPGASRPRTRRIPTLFAPAQWGDSHLWLRADRVSDPAAHYPTPVDMSGYLSAVTVRSAGDGQKLLAIPGTVDHLPAWWMGGAAVQCPAPAAADNPWSVVVVHGQPRRQSLGAAMVIWQFGYDDNASSTGLAIDATGHYQLHFGGATTPYTSSISASAGIDVCIVRSDGTAVTLWVNGTSEVASEVIDITSSPEGLVIGDSIGFVAPYDGMVYELASFPVALGGPACAAINAQLQVQYKTGR